MFKYVYLVDQLILYGTKEHGDDYIQLAALLSSVLFSAQVFQDYMSLPLDPASSTRQWPPSLAKWVSQYL